MATISLSRDQVAELCPECAQKMQLQRVTTLKLHVVDPTSDDAPEFKFYRDDGTEVKVHAGFSDGMCEKFGPDEGLFTRCAEAMAGKVDDEKAFCASLHKFCVGKWPAEKKDHAHAGALSRDELMVQCKKEHPDWTAEQHEAWVEDQMKDYSLRELTDEERQFAENEGEGKWVTMRGRRVFIKKGESAEEALDRSIGKTDGKDGDKGVTPKGKLYDKRPVIMYSKNGKFLPNTAGTLAGAKSAIAEQGKSPVEIRSKGNGIHEVYRGGRPTGMTLHEGTQLTYHEGEFGKSGFRGRGYFQPKAGGPLVQVSGEGTSKTKVHELDDTELHEYSNSIKGIEIFATGTHNGDPYTVEDLDQMVAAAKELDYRPSLKIGHTKDTPGAPSFGWVKNLRRVGEKLYADFEDMHDSVVDAIRKRAYDTCSSEIYFNLKRGGKTFARALKAVALLGAEVPAVANLVPLHKMEFAESGFDGIHAFEQKLDVPTEALFETLSERVAGLINLMKENDMAKNTDQIKALNAQVAEFKAKMNEMMKKKGKMKPEDMDDEEYKQLAAEAQSISDRIAQLESEDQEADSIATLTQQLAEAKAREAKAEADRKELSERVARIENTERVARLGERVKACRVPAYRAGLEALYSYALAHAAETVKIYAKDKDGKDVSTDKALVDIVDGIVSQINADAEKLFKSLAHTGFARREEGASEDASGEVAQRVVEYRSKHPEVKQYEVAMKAVLAADPDLAQRYNAQITGTANPQ